MGLCGSKFQPPRTRKYECITSFNFLKRVDDYALRAPEEALTSVRALADYLTRPFKTDLEKVRAFYRWITENITNAGLDYFIGGTLCCDPEAVLRRRAGVSEGYAHLFLALCNQADIPCHILSGFSKGLSYDPEFPFTPDSDTDHVWNLLLVDGDWRFVDCTWGAGYFNDWTFVKCYEEVYFLTDPEDFVREHFPYMNDDFQYSAKYQLLDEPLSLRTFNHRVKIYSAGLEFGLRTLTHPDWNIDVEREEVIRVQTDHVRLRGLMAYLLKKGQWIRGYTLIRRDPVDSVFSVTVRPPAVGTYVLSLLGRSSTSGITHSLLVSYILTCKEVYSRIRMYPTDRNIQYGASDRAEEYGLAADARAKDVLVTDLGMLDIVLNLTRKMPAYAELTFAEDEDADLVKCVTTTVTEFYIRLDVKLPWMGYYKLTVFGKHPTLHSFDPILTLLLECHRGTST